MEDLQQKIINRLHRIEGQARGIENMVREGKGYAQIIQQLEAMRSATNHIIGILIEDRFCSEEKNPGISPDEIAFLHRFISRQ